jgi:hypothetical protein
MGNAVPTASHVEVTSHILATQPTPTASILPPRNCVCPVLSVFASLTSRFSRSSQAANVPVGHKASYRENDTKADERGHIENRQRGLPPTKRGRYRSRCLHDHHEPHKGQHHRSAWRAPGNSDLRTPKQDGYAQGIAYVSMDCTKLWTATHGNQFSV